MPVDRNTRLRWGALTMALLASCVVVFANHMDNGDLDGGHAWFAGAVSSVATGFVTVGGTQVAMTPATVLVGLDAQGNLVNLAAADLQEGDLASVFAESDSGAPTATAVYRGLPFMIQGFVTAVQVDGQGRPLSVTVDGTFHLLTAQVQLRGMGSYNMHSGMGGNMDAMMGGGCMGGDGMGGGMGGGTMPGCSGGMGGGMGGGMPGDPQPVQVAVGSRVAFGGISANGVYAAVFGMVMDVRMDRSGNPQQRWYKK